MFHSTRQTVNFSLHSIAEEQGVAKSDVDKAYDDIERQLLHRFYNFAQSHFEKCWLHWNMRNTVFGFEHLEHRFRVLTKSNPPTIPYDNRVNINDVLKYKYGPDYVPDPKMIKLMDLNGKRDPRFLSGADEAAAFGRQEFIRMNSSTISKVEFFRYVIEKAAKGKLKTGGRTLSIKIDRALDSSTARMIALMSGVVGIPSGIIGIFLYLLKS